MTQQIGCGDVDFGQVSGQMLPGLPMLGHSVDCQHLHWAGWAVAVYVEAGGHASMLPPRTRAAPCGSPVDVMGRWDQSGISLCLDRRQTSG